MAIADLSSCRRSPTATSPLGISHTSRKWPPIPHKLVQPESGSGLRGATGGALSPDSLLPPGPIAATTLGATPIGGRGSSRPASAALLALPALRAFRCSRQPSKFSIPLVTVLIPAASTPCCWRSHRSTSGQKRRPPVAGSGFGNVGSSFHIDIFARPTFSGSRTERMMSISRR